MRRVDQRGETLVEVVMALGILSLVLVSSYALATGTFRLGRGAGERTQAVNYLQQQAEALRTYRDATDWGTFARSTNTYVGPGADKGFCMVNDPDTKAWKPVAANATECTMANIKVFASTVAATSSIDGNGLPELYKYTFTATWKTGVQDNNVTLTTRLTRQQQ